LGDSLHNHPLTFYLDRLPEKWDAIALNLNLLHPRVFLPLLFLSGLAAVVFKRNDRKPSFQKGLLLALIFADLMVFRMPLGNAFYPPSDIPAPKFPAPQSRSLALLSKTVSPLPAQYGEMAFPNMNFLSGYPNLTIDANPAMARYAEILSGLGWFSWVYKDRDPLGFIHRVNLLQMLGVDQIISDSPLELPPPFQTLQDRYPYAYFLPGTYPKAYLAPPGAPHGLEPGFRPPAILVWGETRMRLMVQTDRPSSLILQKTFLPGWKATVDGVAANPLRFNSVLMTLALPPGARRVELAFHPPGLKLGFFLFFLMSGALVFTGIRRGLSANFG
jgi:hypothetical protein